MTLLLLREFSAKVIYLFKSIFIYDALGIIYTEKEVNEIIKCHHQDSYDSKIFVYYIFPKSPQKQDSSYRNPKRLSQPQTNTA